MAIAFTFPGQGSQVVGMGKDLAQSFASAKAVFDEVDEALGDNLSRIIWEGPQDTLTLTEHTQPALMATSMAVMAVLKDEYGIDVLAASHVAGHSLGEYTALAAAGALTLSDAAILLRHRGQAMQRAVPVGQGTMAALLGATEEQAITLCNLGSVHGVCELANDNAPGQVVISGATKAIETAAAAAKEHGVKKAVILPVSAPFHSSMMEPAAQEMEEALADVAILTPKVPVVTNIAAAPTINPQTIRRQLVEQITGRVHWRQSVSWMVSNGVDTFAEPGSGKVLTLLVRRISKDSKGVALNTAQSIADFAEAINTAGQQDGQE
jgi:[acyl-carrier-protein] S-malonyltransferase